MDGRNRRRALNTLLLAACFACSSRPGSGGEPPKRLPDTSPIYISSRLAKEFLGAVSIDLRLDDKVNPRRAELGLMKLVSPKGAKPTKYKTKVVPIVLEKAPGNSETYVVSRMPADLIKSEETLTIRLTGASGDGDSASLALCGSDGNICQEIKLTQMRPPKEPVNLETEKADDAR